MLFQICSMLTIKTTEQHQYNLLWCLFVELEHMQHRILHKKWSFPLKISSVNVTKSAGNCGLVTVAEEIFNGKLHFLCCGIQHINLRSGNLLKRRPQHKCFHVNFTKFLRKHFFTEHLGDCFYLSWYLTAWIGDCTTVSTR